MTSTNYGDPASGLFVAQGISTRAFSRKPTDVLDPKREGKARAPYLQQVFSKENFGCNMHHATQTMSPTPVRIKPHCR